MSPLDDDNDGIAEYEDNCPKASNPGQEDTDGDRTGDLCDPDADPDGDGISNAQDDDDQDGIPNSQDSCVTDATHVMIGDSDGVDDACDPDANP